MMNYGYTEEIATFLSDKSKRFRIEGYGPSYLSKPWPLEISFRVDRKDGTREVRAYYSGFGKHPYGGHLDHKIIEVEEFPKEQTQKALDYLESLIDKYNARTLTFAEPKITDHWNGTRVILNCEDIYNYITTTLFDKCGLTYDDDFRGTKNYRGKTPAATPLYINDSPDAFVFLMDRYNEKTKKIGPQIYGFFGHALKYVKKGETKSRVEIHFLEYGNGPAGIHGNEKSIVDAYSSTFHKMIKANYRFGEVIPELLKIAELCVKKYYYADFPLTKENFDFLFQKAKVVDIRKIVKKSVTKAIEEYGFEDEKAEQRVLKELKNYTTPIDVQKYPTLARIAEVS